jgi:predicted DnaQ family exonuclease/DinG family helicase
VESFVALDLELTPYAADQQRIIEIGAVRYRDGSVAETYSTLVDPHCDLSQRVATLTGICNEEVRGAPSFEAVIPDFLAFLGVDVLVGQSINMDMNCLAGYGIRPPNPTYDTYDLATLMLPGLPSYDLGTIARSLGVDPDQEHRALGDALTTGQVVLKLVGLIDGLSIELLSHINSLADRLPDWPLTDLFRTAQRRKLRNHFTGPTISHPSRDASLGANDSAFSSRTAGSDTTDEASIFDASQSAYPRNPLRPAEHPSPLELEKLRTLLQPGGVVASGLPGYEERAEQVRMMDAVAEALNGSDHLLVEAGTGTGKSMAYLLPSIYHAVQNGTRVVISTNTVNLQDQLFHKDIPALQGCLPVEFRAALLKGRANYLCLRRWLVLSRTPALSETEILLLIRTLVWLAGTASGDRAELNLSAAESPLWQRISAQAESCALTRCPQFRKGSCFVTRARRNAEGAHIVVVNHALLLTDLARAGGVVPEYSHVVIDEAHHLEEEATEQLGFSLGWGDLYSYLATISQAAPGHRPAGFLPDILSALRVREIEPDRVVAIRKLVADGEDYVEGLQEEARGFFESLSWFMHDQLDERSKTGNRLRITDSVRVQPGWAEIEVRWSQLSERMEQLRRLMHKLESELQTLDDGQLLERDGALAEIAGFQSYLDRMVEQGGEIVLEPGHNGIYWVSGSVATQDLTISSAPLHVGEALNGALFSCKDSVILTSATLTAEGSFEYIRERLGLEDSRELVVGSPFDYRRSTLLYVVQDMPEPARPTAQRAVESTLSDLVMAMEGRTLVLFTSHAQLRTTCSSIRSKLEAAGIVVLAHGLDGSRRRLLQAFKSSPKAVLMGTSSFWEGIDVVGEALSCLVIVKLPFAVPTDPIFAARSEAFEEPFRQYSIPQTILRVKQGFGRLIRSRTDRGVVVMLDSRVGNKFYGPAFIHSLPKCTVRMGPAVHVAEAAKAWLSR